MHGKGSHKAFQNKMMGVRRLKMQMDRIDTSIDKIEINMDEIVSSDVTKDIIESLRRSTQAMKGSITPMGGIEGVQVNYIQLSLHLVIPYPTGTLHCPLVGPGKVHSIITPLSTWGLSVYPSIDS